jgi:hypothetical protein
MLLFQANVDELTLKRINLKLLFSATSNFEVSAGDIVITKVVDRETMQIDKSLVNIDEEQVLDVATAKQLARIVEFLLNLED